ncbi:DMT family transporter [Ferrovibrio terrae]|jgi:drug/metabolite transporter (DMT)-like permease|uniref:DMT family transporter n=1 Tax=Ferrovibrio terrae TaxID=2594003 RepID=UPI0031378E4F
MTARVWGLLIALSILWGGSFFFIGLAVREWPPLSIAASRVVIAAIILLPALHLLGRRLPRDPAIWRACLVIGLLNNVIPFTLIIWAQGQIPSGLASILNATTPIWTALVAHVFTSDERLTPNRILGVLLGFAGVVAMLGPDLLDGLGHNVPAQCAVLLATLSYACSGVYGRRFRRMQVEPIVVATGQLSLSSLVLLPLALLVDHAWLLPLPSLQATAALLALGILSTALAYVLFFRVMAAAGSNVNLVTLLVPVSAILLGVLVLDETLSARHLVGIAAVALGLAAIDGRLLRWIRPAR